MAFGGPPWDEDEAGEEDGESGNDEVGHDGGADGDGGFAAVRVGY
jgi:hypothetical protein